MRLTHLGDWGQALSTPSLALTSATSPIFRLHDSSFWSYLFSIHYSLWRSSLTELSAEIWSCWRKRASRLPAFDADDRPPHTVTVRVAAKSNSSRTTYEPQRHHCKSDFLSCTNTRHHQLHIIACRFAKVRLFMLTLSTLLQTPYDTKNYPCNLVTLASNKF